MRMTMRVANAAALMLAAGLWIGVSGAQAIDEAAAASGPAPSVSWPNTLPKTSGAQAAQAPATVQQAQADAGAPDAAGGGADMNAGSGGGAGGGSAAPPPPPPPPSMGEPAGGAGASAAGGAPPPATKGGQLKRHAKAHAKAAAATAAADGAEPGGSAEMGASEGGAAAGETPKAAKAHHRRHSGGGEAATDQATEQLRAEQLQRIQSATTPPANAKVKSSAGAATD